MTETGRGRRGYVPFRMRLLAETTTTVLNLSSLPLQLQAAGLGEVGDRGAPGAPVLGGFVANHAVQPV